jgi:DNA repair exonuclease SbcCD ATPase subunit
VVVPDATLRERALQAGVPAERVRLVPADAPDAAALLALYEEARAEPAAPLLEGPLAAFRSELDACRALSRAALLREAAGGLQRVARVLGVDGAPADLLDDARRHPLAARTALAAFRAEADWLGEQRVEHGRERKWLQGRVDGLGQERDWLHRDRKALQEEHGRMTADQARHQAEFQKAEEYRTRLESRIEELEREFGRAVEHQKTLETQLRDGLEGRTAAREELQAAFDRAEGHRKEMEALALRLGSELRELEQRLLVRTAERDRLQGVLRRLAGSRVVRAAARLARLRDLKGFRR